MKDKLFKDTQSRVSDFVFDEKVASVFDDMVSRSVPFYPEIQRLVVEIAGEFLQGAMIYDVGCSTGTTIAALLDGLPPESFKGIIGIEPSDAMREKALQKIGDNRLGDRVTLSCKPIEQWDGLPDAQVIVMLFTAQFVRPIRRSAMLRMFYDSLAVGGCVLMAEKILGDDSGLSRMYMEQYRRFKERQGYSTTEIARKRDALENVLVPFRDSENATLFKEAGFTIVDRPLRWCNFALYIAVRS